MLLARCKSIHAASEIGLGKLNAGRQLVTSPCTHPWITNTNATGGQVVITTKNEGEIYPLIKFRSAEIRYPLPNLDDGLRGQNDDSGVTLAVDEDRAFASQYRRERNHRNKQLHDQKMQWSAKHHIDSREKSLHQFDLNIWPNLECNSGGGGHVVLGRNASGKTLLARSIAQSLKGIPDQSLDTYQSDTSTNPMHCPSCTHPIGGNRLSLMAQFLSVPLGMFPLLIISSGQHTLHGRDTRCPTRMSIGLEAFLC